jgi:MtN3 and saliva related transmembrane protein
MNNILVELLGFIAGSLTTFSAIPQVLRVYKTKSTKDLSALTYLSICIGAILWVIYGAIVGSLSVTIMSIISAILNGSILIMKLKDLQK